MEIFTKVSGGLEIEFPKLLFQESYVSVRFSRTNIIKLRVQTSQVLEKKRGVPEGSWCRSGPSPNCRLTGGFSSCPRSSWQSRDTQCGTTALRVPSSVPPSLPPPSRAAPPTRGSAETINSILETSSKSLIKNNLAWSNFKKIYRFVRIKINE